MRRHTPRNGISRGAEKFYHINKAKIGLLDQVIFIADDLAGFYAGKMSQIAKITKLP